MPLAEAEPRTEIAPGTYVVTVRAINADVITPKMGRDAGKEVNVFRWDLDTEDGEPLDYLTRRDPTSEKSNFFKALVALGVPRAEHLTVEASDLIGRQCFALVSINDDGYNRVDSLSPLPVRRAQGPVAGPATVAASEVPAPVPTAEAETDDLPF